MRQKLRNNRLKLVVVIGLAVCLVVVIASPKHQLSTKLVANVTNSSLSPVTAVLSANADKPDYVVTVANVSQGTVDTISQTKRLTISPVIQNQSAHIMEISPGLQMFLIDDQAVSHNMTAKFLAPGVVVGGPLASGSSTRIDVDFEIPVNSSPKQFIFQYDGSAVPVVLGL